MRALLILLAAGSVLAGEPADLPKRGKVLREKEARKLASVIAEETERAFEAEPAAKTKLAHLSPIVGEGLRKPGWLRVLKGMGAWGNARGVKGVDMAVELEDKPMDAAETLWHEVQHIYDRAWLERQTRGAALLSVIFPLEAEMRGHDAGCLIRRSKPCPEFPLSLYACGHDWAAEQTLWSYEELLKKGSTPAQVQEALDEWDKPKPPPPPGQPEWRSLLGDLGSSAEREVRAECAEAERALTGNILTAADPSWKIPRCLEECAKAVLKDGWKSSDELCGVPGRKKTPPRELARKVLDVLGRAGGR